MREGRRHYRNTHLRKEKRTIPVSAEGSEQGRYYKCWNCGFICDKQKNALDDGHAGTAHRPATIASGRIIGDSNSVKFRVGTPVILRQLDLLGNAKPVYIERRVLVTSGCPGCGSRAWKD